MKMMFHIDDFKCTLCANWFCPPFNLPYLLPCTHSICTNCLQKASNNDHIICPQDLQACPIQSININLTTKRALERLMKEHKNYNDNTQLQCIKALSIGFDEILSTKQKNLRNLQALIDQIFHSEIGRLKQMHKKIKTDINRPFKIVEDWKEIVTNNLTNIRKNHNNNPSYDSRSNSMLQLNHYIEEGRKMKMEINQFFQIDFDNFADQVMRNPKVCFEKDFTINQQTLKTKLKGKPARNSQAQILLEGRTAVTKSKKFNQNSLMQANELDEAIQNNTIFLNRQNKRNLQQKQNNKQPLGNIDMNTMNISEFQEFDNGCPVTRRGNNKEKAVNEGKLKEMSSNIQRYITFEKNQGESPVKKGKMVEIPKNKARQQTKIEQAKQKSKNGQLSLSQFQLQPPQDQNYQQSFKNKSKLNKQQTPKLIKQRQLIPEKQSPSLHNESQNERLNKLANMLDNRSSLASQHNNSMINSGLKKSNKQNDFKAQISAENSLLMSPNVIRQQYTEQANQEQDEQQQLLNEDENNWELGHINFLKQWKLKTRNPQEEPLEIRQNYIYNCEKEKLSYMRKMQIFKVQQLYKLTQMGSNYIELINQSLHDVDISLYLQQFDWKHSNIEIVKLVKTDLKDEQLNILLNYLVNSNVKTLVLTQNLLTDVSLDAFLNFVDMNNVLKNVYLGSNHINTLKTKPKINLFKDKGITIYI